MSITKEIETIRRLKDFNYLLVEKQDGQKIKEYYNKNKIAYLFFHNRLGYLHMVISQGGKYRKADLLKQVDVFREGIEKSFASRILELGYGRG